MASRIAWSYLAPALLGLGLACADSNPGAGETLECVVGSEACPCTDGGACDAGLTCASMLCVDAGDSSSASETETSSEVGGDGDGDGDGDSDGGSSGDGDGDGGPSYTLSMSFSGNGRGDASGNGIDCGDTCDALVTQGASVTITAEPFAGSALATWASGPCMGSADLECTFTMSADTELELEFNIEHNLAFTSSIDIFPPFGGHIAADQHCQMLANASEVPGTFKAWISTSDLDAKTKFENIAASGWVRMDGKPFALDLASLTSGVNIYPLIFAETGEPVGSVQYVATGTNADGTMAFNCNDFGGWGDDGKTTGYAGGGGDSWTNGVPIEPACTTFMRLYCLGTDLNNPIPAPAPVAGRVAFVSTLSFSTSSGLAFNDARCAQDAMDAGLSGTFLALAASDGSSALDRFDLSGPTWVRPDGVAITGEPTNLANGDPLDAPIAYGADGSPDRGGYVRTGATSPGQAGTSETTCSDWTETFESGHTGFAAGVGGWFYAGVGLSGCQNPHRIICLEE